jgi:hypothetical protein
VWKQVQATRNPPRGERQEVSNKMDNNTVGAVIGGITMAGVFGLLMILVWQVLATSRTKIGATREATREKAYQDLAADIVSVQSKTIEQLEQTSAGLAAVAERTDEIARMLKEVG